MSEIANLFSVTPQHVCKMATSGKLPSFPIAGAIWFDPQDLVNWLKAKQNESQGCGAKR